MDERAEYWREAVEYAFDACGLWDAIKDIPTEKLLEVGASLSTSADCQSLAFYTPENPMIAENKRLERKLKWERELVGCHECGGSGGLEYSSGPWAVSTTCDRCNGAGKVHPDNERAPT